MSTELPSVVYSVWHRPFPLHREQAIRMLITGERGVRMQHCAAVGRSGRERIARRRTALSIGAKRSPSKTHGRARASLAFSVATVACRSVWNWDILRANCISITRLILPLW